MGELKIDIDEIDAFGFILDDTLKNGYNTIKKSLTNERNIEFSIMINNSVYRNDVNNRINFYGLNVFADEFLNKKSKEAFNRIFKIVI
jgi:hypothetical protein